MNCIQNQDKSFLEITLTTHNMSKLYRDSFSSNKKLPNVLKCILIGFIGIKINTLSKYCSNHKDSKK